jgi:type III pantothenate kinase
MGNWLFDLGNTRLKCVPLHADGSLGEVLAAAHDGRGAAPLRPVLPAAGEVAYLASVAAPALTLDLLDALTDRFRRIAIVRTPRRFAGVRIAYEDPGKLGVDRFLALLGAHETGAATLVVAVGTALTIDLLDAGGQHLGGRIAPSPSLMREALHARAAQLPATGGRYAEFADDTETALASGCEGAALALVERSRQAATVLLGGAPRTLLHGGGAAALLPHLPEAEHAPRLLLQGLARWARVEAGSGIGD